MPYAFSYLFKHFGLQLEESRMQKGPKMKKDSPRIKKYLVVKEYNRSTLISDPVIFEFQTV